MPRLSVPCLLVGLALFAISMSSHAVLMTYNVQFFDPPPGTGPLAGTGFFTVDTAGFENDAGECSLDNCLLDFGFDIFGIGSLTSTNTSFALTQFLADVDGIITDYIFYALNADTQLVFYDVPLTGTVGWVAYNSQDAVAECSGQGCVITSVPEPTILALLSLGLVLLGFSRFRKAELCLNQIRGHGKMRSK